MLFEPTLNLDDLNGINGLTLNGSSGPVSNIGDINGDGFDDVIIGPPGFRFDSSGFDSSTVAYAQGQESYVVFGGQEVVGGRLNLPTLDEPNGFILDFALNAASAAGDINGDGLDDVIIGSSIGYTGPIFDPNTGNYTTDATSNYVVFGNPDISQNDFDLTALDGSNGFAISDLEPGDFSSRSSARGGSLTRDFFDREVNAAGDINGDGLDDIIIGAPYADRDGISDIGESYVIFGASNFSSGNLELSALDGQNGFVINGIDSVNFVGRSVSGAGDINGDGIDDLLIGARADIPDSAYDQTAGEVYVVFGGQDFSSGSFDLATLDGSNGFVASARPDVENYSFLRADVSNAGDINGDGIDDIAIGTPNFLSIFTNLGYDTGSYVVFGSRDAFSSSLSLNDLDGGNGFIIDNTDEVRSFGRSISGISDINGDGFDDILIGTSPFIFDDNYIGADFADRSYVIFGGPDFSDSPLDAAGLDGSDGFTIPVGTSVSSTGDFNGDGLNDFIVGDGNGNETGGVSYIVFGRDPEVPVFRTDAAALTTPENTRFITDLEAIDNLDSEGNGLTYSLTGGVDQAFFSLDAVSGELSLDLIPDFENPADADQDNTYEVAITVADSDGFSQTGVFAIDVTDVSFGTITPADLNGSNGFVVEGINESNRLGLLVNTAGDINGDGFDDVIIGASNNELYVVFGGPDFSSDRLNLADLDGNNGFMLEGADFKAINARDINNDGIDDLVIETSELDDENASETGQTFVLFGRRDFNSRLDLAELDSVNDLVISDDDNRVGDINGDGFDDFLVEIERPFSLTRFGYIVFGQSDGSEPSSFNVETTSNGRDGFQIDSPVASGLGDINDDGFDDLIVSSDGFFSTNSAFVRFGEPTLDIADLANPRGFTIGGADDDDRFDFTVNNAGDVDGDRVNDIIIGAPGAAPNGVETAGETYVIFSGDILNPPSLVVDAVLSVPENNTTVVDVEATDDRYTENNGLVYRITDGADQNVFAIDPFTGNLSFTTAPDFETPNDADGDNIYEVEVSVTNAVDLSDTQLLTITVLDADENGSGSDPILFATGDGDLILSDFDIDEGAEFGTPESTFDTLSILDGAFPQISHKCRALS